MYNNVFYKEQQSYGIGLKGEREKESFVVVVVVVFLGPYPQHMEVPRIGVESGLQLPAYTTATATWDPSLVCDVHHNSQQHWILNPLNEVRD